MLNKIWGFMILMGVVYASLTGNITTLSNAALDSAKEAVTLCITMLGVMAFWVGMMEIAKEAGLVSKMTKALGPFVHFLFPRIPRTHRALEYISTNIVANILGLGWAATPAGLKAMEELASLEAERGNEQYCVDRCSCKEDAVKDRTASLEMCTFLIINISSLQLIPVNIIAYRSQYGSVDPTAIILPAIFATAASTLAAIVFCKWMAGHKR